MKRFSQRQWTVKKKPAKYRSKTGVCDGIKFDSLKEMRYYKQLKLRQQAGEIVMFLRQVPLHLPGGTKLVLDFVEFHEDGTVHFLDVKSPATAKKESFLIKKREVEQHYNIEIELAN